MIRSSGSGDVGRVSPELVMEEREVLPADASGAREGATAGERVRALVTLHFAFVWRSLCHLGLQEADADDAAQQVFLTAAKKLDAIERGSERAYLFGVALRIASRARRSRARRREVFGAPAVEATDSRPGPDELIDRSRAVSVLEEALDAMAPDVRAAFVLFEIEQLSKSEVASALGIPEGTVASRVRRGREEFSKHVRRCEARTWKKGGGP
jgi:RNA polymerase sigma-70 factor (ECF subfamily)